MAGTKAGGGRSRGYIRKRGGTYQVLVYAGVERMSRVSWNFGGDPG
jgi:hypothetical protein